MVFTLRRLHLFSSTLHKGEWRGPMGFGADLRGRTVGIHGCGHIGKEVVKLLQPYGVKILANDKVDYSGFYREWGVEGVSADELWARSDVVTIHLSRNSGTIGMYTGAVLDKMKPGAVLINCARGNIVDEVALAERLKSGHIAGAAFDVFAVEPANGNPLADLAEFLRLAAYRRHHDGILGRDAALRRRRHRKGISPRAGRLSVRLSSEAAVDGDGLDWRRIKRGAGCQAEQVEIFLPIDRSAARHEYQVLVAKLERVGVEDSRCGLHIDAVDRPAASATWCRALPASTPTSLGGICLQHRRSS